MAIEERKNNTSTNTVQNLVLENREKLSISGVLDVLSFDDQVVIVETELGLLTIKGDNLRINKLSIDTSEVIVEGEIYNIAYSDSDLDKKNNGFLNKINSRKIPVKIQNNASSIYVIISGVLNVFLRTLKISNNIPINIPDTM